MSYYKANNRSFAAFMLSQQMQRPVTEVAEAIAADAAVNTPKKSGAMASSYEVNETAPVTVNGSPRVTAEVRNSDPAAPAVEFGGKRNKAERPLGRAASKFGDVRGADGA